ncbi:hypothetical protein BGX21_003186 [Mortierella sp. AD011]|nr:hypothetical protein BGX20_001672 [Mortierella sp. AD010]KAF9377462.1 hypothetical protein BGX21_003186 [Mortierella sp. AD011]
MTERVHTQLEYDENDEQGFYNEEEDQDAEYDENEEEYEDQDGGNNFEIGQEIALSHQEVWDDSALIEAWDMAVKQYEVYHSKTKPDVKALTSSPISSKTKAKTQHPTTQPTKRVKLNHDQSIVDGDNNVDESVSNNISTNASEIRDQLVDISFSSNPEQEVPAIPAVTAAATTAVESTDESMGYTATTGRKPSFRKADKSSFSHHKESQVENVRSNTKTPRTKPELAKSKATPQQQQRRQQQQQQQQQQHAPIDAATIAYYQQLGYYYDPSYDTSAAQVTAETGGDQQDQDQNEEMLDDGMTQNNVGSKVKSKGRNSRVPAATLGSTPVSNSFAKNSHASSSNTANAGTFSASSAPTAQTPSFWPGSVPTYPSTQSPYQQGYYPGMQGAFSGMPPTWGARGGPAPMPMPMPMPMPTPMPMPMPYGQMPNIPTAAAAGGDIRQQPVGMMPPAPSMMGGQFSGSGMDDDALSNLIMAWYFSGYYTGLYQAQRR